MSSRCSERGMSRQFHQKSEYILHGAWRGQKIKLSKIFRCNVSEETLTHWQNMEDNTANKSLYNMDIRIYLKEHWKMFTFVFFIHYYFWTCRLHLGGHLIKNWQEYLVQFRFSVCRISCMFSKKKRVSQLDGSIYIWTVFILLYI